MTKGQRVLEASREIDPISIGEDLLEKWIRPDALKRIRCIQAAIHAETDHALTPSEEKLNSIAASLSTTACFLYTALFATLRDLLSRYRTSNPMWLLEPKSYRHRIAPTWEALAEVYLSEVKYFSHRLSIPDSGMLGRAQLLTSNSATTLSFETGEFDGAITSPPYATRMDYVKGTLAELGILGATKDTVSRLRKETTGSPVLVKKTGTDSRQELLSVTGRKVLVTIKSHPSKGSANYYYKWMRNYLLDLQQTLSELDRIVSKPDGHVCIVVQDSYYKEQHIDLQSIVIEMFRSIGRSCITRRNYSADKLWSDRNPRSLHYKNSRKNTESLLVFK